jgi:hypothetical protein
MIAEGHSAHTSMQTTHACIKHVQVGRLTVSLHRPFHQVPVLTGTAPAILSIAYSIRFIQFIVL